MSIPFSGERNNRRLQLLQVSGHGFERVLKTVSQEDKCQGPDFSSGGKRLKNVNSILP
jgi:hypothetical protein